jgi:general secretion pathway protein C
MKKPRFEKFLPSLFFIFLGFCIADLLILNFRDLMLPNQAPPSRPKRSRPGQTTSKGSYSTVISRNIFSSDGTIPDALLPAGQEAKPNNQQDLPPVLSNLPLGLVGTIVHSNPEKSIANIELRGKNQVLAYRPKMDIEKIATLIRVERNKIIIRNTNNQRLEFLEMKSTSKLNFSSAKAAPPATSAAGGEVQQLGQNRFQIKRADVLKYTSNMADVLQQAAMAPKRNATGEIEGFKFLSIQPGSIYTQLGFQNGDVIKGVNGEPVDSPAKAMELYNQLKTSNNIKMKVERDGRDQDFEYDVK